MSLRCSGCQREIEIGDQYIEGTASDFLKKDVDPEMESLMADILGGHKTLGGQAGGKIIYCEDCTQPGGDFRFQTYYGDEDQ